MEEKVKRTSGENGTLQGVVHKKMLKVISELTNSEIEDLISLAISLKILPNQ